MLIKRVSNMSGIEHEMEIDITEQQLQKWRDGMLIQHAMPTLTADEREFLMTGIIPEEWDSLFSK